MLSREVVVWFFSTFKNQPLLNDGFKEKENEKEKDRVYRIVFRGIAPVSNARGIGAARAPFGGQPVQVPQHLPDGNVFPARIEVEAFDEGGEGVAYHDADAGNNGGMFRDTDVDIGSDGFSQTHPGNYVGETLAGEWLEYTVNVLEAGYYLIETQVGSQGRGGTFHIEFNGVDKTGPLSVPDTGGWLRYQILGKQGVYLSAGVQTMRLALDTVGRSGSVANFNRIEISPSVAQIPGSVGFVRFDAGGEGVAYHDADVGNNGSGYRDGDVDIDGDVAGWTQAGEWRKCTVNV